jgi:hypothetical protein
MGMSQYSEDLPSEYFCELCHPEDHKELLAGIAKGEKPWEERRRAYEEEQEKKRRRGPKKGKGKRHSDPKEESSQSQKSKPSPAIDSKTEAKAAAGAKRKARDGSLDIDTKVCHKASQPPKNCASLTGYSIRPPRNCERSLKPKRLPSRGMSLLLIFHLTSPSSSNHARVQLRR